MTRELRELTDAELDQVCGGLTGGGVATAITEGGTLAVLNALGPIGAADELGNTPEPIVGHGKITAPGA